jgi:diguanylate cyclase (GGDEF)-like protein/PAS domain S-box-containing protein
MIPRAGPGVAAMRILLRDADDQWMKGQPKDDRGFRRRLPRSVSARIVVAALALAVIMAGGLGALVWALVDQRATQRDATRTEAMLTAASELEASAIDLESGSRGFAITSNPDFLAPWLEARLRIPGEIANLRTLTGDAEQRVRVERLVGLIRDYEAASGPIVEAVGRDAAAARATIGGGRGKRQMDEIRARSAGIASAEHRLAETRRKQSESAANVALALGLAGALGSVLLIIGFAAYLRGLILRPVKRVAAAAERFAGGDRTARAPTGGATELDLLARSFNDMARAVQVESAERARVQAELRDRGDEFRALAENSPDIIVRVDAGMHISYVNSVVVGVTGLTAESFLGRSILEIEGELPVPLDWSRALREVLDTGEPRTIEQPFESPAGTVLFESRMIPETSPDGVVGHALVLSRDVTDERSAETRLRADEREQDALRRVATAVASERSAPELFKLVAKEAGRLLDMEMAGVSRFVAVGPALVEGAWSAPGAVGDGAVDESWGDAVTLTGEATIFGAPPGPGEDGGVIGVAAPIRVGQRLWGAVAASTTRPGDIDPAATGILSRFAELVSLAISSSEAREQLLALASTDPLTGLPNLRTFTQRLGDEVVRARRHSRPLSLMMIDIDHFKLVNDTHGHDVGNRVLIEIARRLARLVRGEDTVARVGGEEFAWILPESDGRDAYWVAERARAAIAETPFPLAGHLTISAGVCEIDAAAYPDELFRRADAALYAAKAQGRNTTVRWSPDDDAIPTRSSPAASTSGPEPPDSPRRPR